MSSETSQFKVCFLNLSLVGVPFYQLAPTRAQSTRSRGRKRHSWTSRVSWICSATLPFDFPLYMHFKARSIVDVPFCLSSWFRSSALNATKRGFYVSSVCAEIASVGFLSNLYPRSYSDQNSVCLVWLRFLTGFPCVWGRVHNVHTHSSRRV